MGTTPNYTWPYPELTDKPDGATQIKALANAADSSLKGVADKFGALQSYTPAIVGGITLGNGTITGRYRRNSGLVWVQVTITAAASSPTTAFSSGAATVKLPLVADVAVPYGHCMWTGRIGISYINPNNTDLQLQGVNPTTLVSGSAGTIWGTAAWTVSGQCQATLIYSTSGAAVP